jgi:hypothetical protein
LIRQLLIKELMYLPQTAFSMIPFTIRPFSFSFRVDGLLLLCRLVQHRLARRPAARHAHFQCASTFERRYLPLLLSSGLRSGSTRPSGDFRSPKAMARPQSVVAVTWHDYLSIGA